MRIYTNAERERVTKMIEAFELCITSDTWRNSYVYVYICHRLKYLYANNFISLETRQDCDSLIRRTLGEGCFTLDSYLRRQGMEIPLCDSRLRYELREWWLAKLVHDLTRYVRFGWANAPTSNG